MAKCGNCAGGTCGCLITSDAGSGIIVSGTGTSSDPFKLKVDSSSIGVGASIAVASSTTLELAKTGSGGTGDPVVIAGDVVFRSANGTRWTLAVSNTGTLSAVAAGAPRSGSGGSTGGGGGGGGGGTVTVSGGDNLYWDGTAWETRTAAAHVGWWSLGFTGVPIPPGFKKGDTWVCEAT